MWFLQRLLQAFLQEFLLKFMEEFFWDCLYKFLLGFLQLFLIGLVQQSRLKYFYDFFQKFTQRLFSSVPEEICLAILPEIYLELSAYILTRIFFRNACWDFSSLVSCNNFSNCSWGSYKNLWRDLCRNQLRNSSKTFWWILPDISEYIPAACMEQSQREFLKVSQVDFQQEFLETFMLRKCLK